MTSQEDRGNAKTRGLIMRQHGYVARHQTNMDQLKQRLTIKKSQIARQAEYEAQQFRSAASSRPGGLEAKYLQCLDILESWLRKQPPRPSENLPGMP
jgi:hypothetical protein